MSIHPRTIRGEPWAVLQNSVNGEHVRLNGPALAVLRSLDGVRSITTLARLHGVGDDEDARQALSICLLTLESNGMISLGLTGDAARLVERSRRAAAGRRWHKRFDPLSIRIPLVDPDSWITRMTAWLPRSSQRWVGWVLMILLGLSGAVVLGDIDAIGTELRYIANTPSAWWYYALLYPVLKLVHELAHAVAVKFHGGSVHEAGMTLLVLMPVPYVDASDSSHFPRRADRLAVVAAGMVAEALVASTALLLWSVTEAGVLHDVAFAAAVLGSASTLLFNANPLLRFDGYHLLQDGLDMPNLGSRSTAYLRFLLKRFVLRSTAAHAPHVASGEKHWLIGYGLSSVLYRVGLTLTIAWYLVDLLPLVGSVLALVAIWKLFGRPLLAGIAYLAQSEEIAGHRLRAVSTILGSSVLVVTLIAWVPLPASTRATGVVRLADQSTLHSPASGRVAEVSVTEGSLVVAGDVVATLDEPEMRARLNILSAEIALLETRRQAALRENPAEARRLASDLSQARREHRALSQGEEDLVVRATNSGRFAPIDGALVVGRPVTRGEPLGHVVSDGLLRVDAVIEQRQIGRVRSGVIAASVRLAERPSHRLDAELVSNTPKADRRLPSRALAYDGTRGIAVASTADGMETLEPVFHVELGLPAGARSAGIGGRAFVTLVHEPESLGSRWWRSVRQLFLARLSV